jgi:superoxide dismutase, Cu-Zn family
MIRIGSLAVVALALSGCIMTSASSGERAIASGPLKLADGSQVGSVAVLERAGGALALQLTLTRYAPGTYGMHVHAVGRCEGPAFASAGPHWNPTARQHGRLNAAGTHHGDLPNLRVGSGGTLTERWPLTGSARGEGGLLDADGAAFIIHASADDERTDPTGNSGARVACAELVPTRR